MSIQPRQILCDLFQINRGLAGPGVRETLLYIKDNILPESEIFSLQTGAKAFDWTVPSEWKVRGGYVENAHGKKIIEYEKNFLHIASHSCPVDKVVDEQELIAHLHTLPERSKWIPYRTLYYKEDWAFCCTQDLVNSSDFIGPFKVKVDSERYSGHLNWLECLKKGDLKQEIVISTYCCHPNLANDNLSGLVAACLIMRELRSINTRFSYRLVIAPETIGTIAFLSQANIESIKGGMILSCVAGPDRFSIKNGFDENHFINKAAHLALRSIVGDNYDVYPFVPNGSDERQYSSPGIRKVTPSIHRSKYHEYDEYHTSADNLDFISIDSLQESISVHLAWIKNIESFCIPIRTQLSCEFQLGKRNLYPSVGGSISQPIASKKSGNVQSELLGLNKKIEVTHDHVKAFSWLMFMCDGSNSNFDISTRSGIELSLINDY